MKKNKMMRLASGLLVAVLITTSTISGTYAKYVTEGTATDSARVARFGVTVTAATDDVFFSDTYKDTGLAYVTTDSDQTITVRADAAGVNVVAPGTEGTLAEFIIAGTPEVDVEVSYIPEITLTGWGDYFPVVFTVGGETYGLTGALTKALAPVDHEYATTDLLIADVKAAIVSKGAIYETLTDLSTVVPDDLVVSWEWPFSTSAANDIKDTALGDAAAARIEFSVKCMIEQID